MIKFFNINSQFYKLNHVRRRPTIYIKFSIECVLSQFFCKASHARFLIYLFTIVLNSKKKMMVDMKLRDGYVIFFE